MIRLVLHQTRYDLLTFARNRQARFFTVLLPVMFLVIFVSVFGNQLVGPEHIKASTYYVPGIAALAVLSAAFSNLVIAVTTQRELGVLKRRRATPAAAAVIIAGRALTALVVAVAVTAVVIAIGTLAYGVASRARLARDAGVHCCRWLARLRVARLCRVERDRVG